MLRKTYLRSVKVTSYADDTLARGLYFSEAAILALFGAFSD